MCDTWEICSDCGQQFKITNLFKRYITKRLSVLVCEDCYERIEDSKIKRKETTHASEEKSS